MPVRTPLPDSPDAVRMSIGEHLEELRGCLFRSLIALVVACLACIYPARWIMEVLTRPVILVLRHQGQVESFLQTSPLESFMIYVKVVVIAGLIIASPYILFQLWSFVAAGLYKRERAFVYKMIGPSAGLFALGVLFMYFFVLLLSLNFLVGFSKFLPMPEAGHATWLERQLLGIADAPATATQPASGPLANIPILWNDPPAPKPGDAWYNASEGRLKVRVGPDPGGAAGPGAGAEPSAQTFSTLMQQEESRALIETHFKIGDYLSFVLMLTVAFGVAFQMPLVVVFLARSGLVSVKIMRSYRRVVILAIVFVAGMLAPPDLFSHLSLSLPMWLLFEIGLLFAARKRPAPTPEAVPPDAVPPAA